MAYADPTAGDDANAIQDAVGNDTASFTTGSGGVPAVPNNSTVTATAPAAPTAPTVAGVSGSSTRLTVSWSAPADNGSAITSYDLQYRQGTSGNFTDGPQGVNGTSVDPHRPRREQPSTRSRCAPPTPRATPTGRPSGSGTTNAATTAPTVGAVWSGTLTVRDSLGSLGCSNGFSGSYCSDYLSDDDFTYDSTDYAITTLWVLENGRLQFIFDTVPVLTSTETLALALTLNLDGTAFAFEDAVSKGVDFRRWNNSGLSWTVGATVSATVTVTGTTAPTNNVPVFNPVAVSRSVAENTAAGENVGDPVTATDADTGDTLTYTLGGTDAASFDIVAASGQVQTKTGVTYDHEAKASYAVTVTASDGTATADATVTISVTDVAEPPTAPAAPAVAGVSGSTTSLMVSWTAPGNTGKPAIASYDVQYRQGTSGAFTNGPQDVNGTSATITGLTADTLYQVQVRATNAEGDSGWSASGSGTTADPPGVTVSPSALTVAEGTTVPYTVRLNSRPTGTVTVTPSSDNPAGDLLAPPHSPSRHRPGPPSRR